ncbi:UNVERIFIED_CONTAM: hypothetical protein GTU68_060654 [Idotea baltica]|nr:hypothetical protein [Idotea baltica]
MMSLYATMAIVIDMESLCGEVPECKASDCCNGPRAGVIAWIRWPQSLKVSWTSWCGLDNIDMECLRCQIGIAVPSASGANDLSVAEYVITNALVLLRGAYLSTADVAAGKWPRGRLMGREISGKILGLVGYGAIARETAQRATALGMNIIGFDPFLQAGDPQWGETEKVSLEDLLSRADVVSLHVPLTDDTKNLINETALKSMKPDAILINAARGGVVDEAALAAVLRQGHLGGAALDVFETEPVSAQAGAKFADIPNLILTPHIAGVTDESNIRVSEVTVANVLSVLQS